MGAVYRPETRQEESHRTFIDRCPTKSNAPKLTLFPTVGELEGAQDARYEVDLQGGAPLREEEGRGRENQAEVPEPCAGHRGEGPQGAAGRPGQEEVPGSLGPDGRTVLLPHPEADQPQARGRALLLRQQHIPPPPRPPWEHSIRSTTKRTSSCTSPTRTRAHTEKSNEMLRAKSGCMNGNNFWNVLRGILMTMYVL